MSQKFFKTKAGVSTPAVTFTNVANANLQISYLESNSLSFSGTSGQLFSVTDSMSGTIFGVNDVSGVPSIEVLDTGIVRLAETFGNVLIGTSTDNGSKLQVTGNISVTGTIDGRDVSVDGTKLDGIEAGATADMTATEILNAIKTVDGVGSGLDADLLDGLASATAATASTVVVRDASGNFAANIITGNITGNAGTVTNGIYATNAPLYDRGTLAGTGDWNTFTSAGVYQIAGASIGTNGPGGAYAYGQLVITTNSNTVTQTYTAHTTPVQVWARIKYSASDWQPWILKLTNSNFTSYAPSLTGAGATGTWGINITGNASTATTWQTSRNLSIGNTSKPINGSADVSWSINEIGAEVIQPDGIPRNNLGDPTVREMALFDGQFSNKTDLYPINSIFIETSTDNVTWTNYAISDDDKRRLVGGDNIFSGLIIPYGTAYYRIRLRAATAYVFLDSLYMYWSGNGHSTKVQIFKKHDSGPWTQHTNSDVLVSSWPGHLYLPFGTIPWNPTAALGSHWHEVYVLFIPTWNSSFTANPINLSKMQWWGGYPFGRRNLYSTSEFGDATFPAAISAVGNITQNGNQVLNAGNYTSYSPSLTGTGASGNWGINVTGSAAKLTTGRTIALTGDVTYNSGVFDGSANVTAAATLASVGTAGTYTKVTTDAKGRVTSGTTLAASDIPSLDAAKITSGTIDAARLPSYVDDVIEADNLASFPATGEIGKIYVALDTNKTYRWSGSAYIFITSGAVDSVSGKTGVVTLVKADVGLGNVDNTSDATKNVLSAGNVTGVVAIANGGTGAANAATARTNLGLGTLATQSGTISGTNTGDQSIFQTIAVSGQSSVVADTTTDTLTLASGTGIGITTNATTDTITITNSAPDQTVSLTQSGTVTVTGTYPSFTIAGAATNIAEGTRTSTTVPITSSTGTGATLSAATTTLAGLLTGADKTKLNGIAAGATANQGTVTSVSGTGSYGGLTLSGTVTGSGSLTLGGTPTGTWPISVSGTTFSSDATTKADITTRTETGFYETDTGTLAEGWPTNTGGWHHLIATTHSNDANYYSMQLSSTFNDQQLYFRATSGSGTTPWSTILHSGNYSSYALPLSGGTVTGNISVTGTVDGRDLSVDGAKLDGIAAGATANQGTVTSVSGTGSYGGLTLSGTVTGSGSLTLGGTPTGTWPISVSGSAVTASNISNTGTVTLASATESNSVYITAPSYAFNNPVKLLNFDWYNNLWSLGNIRSTSTGSNGLGFYYTASGGSIVEVARFDTSKNLSVAGNITAFSDANLKENVTTIEGALNKVSALRGVEFDWKENGKHNLGLIAQEVESVLPDLVTEREDGIKTVAYANIVAVLIEAIKELRKEVEELKK